MAKKCIGKCANVSGNGLRRRFAQEKRGCLAGTLLEAISDRTSVQFCVSVLYRGECRTDRHGTAAGCDQCQSGTDWSVLFVQGIRVCLQPFLLCGRIPE